MPNVQVQICFTYQGSHTFSYDTEKHILTGSFKYWKALFTKLGLKHFPALNPCHFNDNQVPCDPLFC